LLAGSAVEVAALPERLLVAVVLSSARRAPVEALGRSAVFSALAALSGRGVLSLLPVFVMAAPAFEDLREDGVDRVGIGRGAGWRRCGAECCRLPGRRRAPPSPRFSGGEGGGFRRQNVLCDEEVAGAQKDLFVILLCFWAYL
jgi:stage V sporulation protein SpoVS